MLIASGTAMGLDSETSRDLDRNILAVEEARLQRNVDLRQAWASPQTPSPEATHLITRIATLHAEMTQSPVHGEHRDGTQWAEHPRTSTAFSRLVQGADGQPRLECAGYDDTLAKRLLVAGVDLKHYVARKPASSPEQRGAEGATKASGKIFTAVYTDRAGYGFNDPRPVAPVPGNPATTLGGQRKNALQKALDIWATRLNSELTIRVQASFEDLGCGEGSWAGFGNVDRTYSNFSGAPRRELAYPAALATALSGTRLTGAAPELRIRLNPRYDEDCTQNIPNGYWYGIDASAPSGSFSFVNLATHEIGHGLGFLPFVDLSDGDFTSSRPSVYASFLHSVSLQRTWPQLSSAQRRTTARNEPDLVWTGPNVDAALAKQLRPPAQIRMVFASGAEARAPAFMHEAPPTQVELSGLTAAAIVANNAVDDPSDPERVPTDACQPLTGDAQGRIVLATRGVCTFTEKWQHAYAAGAAALLVIDNVDETHDRRIIRNQGISLSTQLAIPIWSVSRNVGLTLLADPPASLTLGFDPDQPLLGTHAGHAVMEGSATSVNSSNVSHFSKARIPQSVMASSVSNAAQPPDFAVELLYDLGWPDGSTKHGQYTGSWAHPERSGEGCQVSLEADGETYLLACFQHRAGQQVWLTGITNLVRDELDFRDVIVTHGARYGAEFDPADVQRTPWGRILLQILDCNSLNARFEPHALEAKPFLIPLTRLVRADCQTSAAAQPDRSFGGAFHDPTRPGEGVLLVPEADDRTLTLAWYSYLDEQQLWVAGSATRDDARAVFGDMVLVRGGDYGPDFDPAAAQRLAFGRVEVERLDCQRLRVRIDPSLPGFTPSERIMTRLVPGSCSAAD